MTEPAPTPTDGHPAFHEAVAQRVVAERASESYPTDGMRQIEAALTRRTTRTPATSLASHLRALDMAADIDAEAPVASSRAAGRGVKVAVQRLTGWYVGHLAGQVRHLGVATARAVRASVARVDELERRVEALEAHDADDDRGDANDGAP